MNEFILKYAKVFVFVLAVMGAFGGKTAAQETPLVNNISVKDYNITEKMVMDAQKAWADALIDISRVHSEGGDYRKAASETLDRLYNYDKGPVLFKPTLTSGDQTFRLDRAGAMAYFVGGDTAYKGDTGFALRGWTKYKTDTKALILNGTMALSIGKVYLYDKAGNEVAVDKTWGYKMYEYGKLRIVLHHSSLPFKPAQ